MNPWEKYASESAPAEKPWEKYGGTAVAEAAPESHASLADKMVGGWGGRMLMGMASPVLAGVQMAGGEKGRELVAALDAMKQRGMKAEGKDGFDWYGLLGSLAPGAGIAKGVTAALPAATSALGRIGTGAAIGAATSAAQPVSESPNFWTDKAKQVGIGTAIGGAIPALGEVSMPARSAPALNPVELQTLQKGQKAGYVVPASKINPSPLNDRLESIAGKASVQQEAALRNQKVTDALAAKALGLPANTPLTEGVLRKVRQDAGKVYEEVGKLKPPASMEWFPRFHEHNLVDQLQQVRADASDAFKRATIGNDPAARATGDALLKQAESIHGDIANIAKANGREDLVKALAEARVKIAKAHDVERALNLGNAGVSAPRLGAQLDKAGVAAKSGELSIIGKMAEAFPSVMRESARVPASSVSGTDAAAHALLGATGYGAAGPVGLLAAGLPLLRTPARNLVLSPAYQRMVTNGISPRNQELINAILQQGAGAAGTAAGRLSQ